MIVFRYFIFDSLSVLLLNLGTLSFIEFKDGENQELFGEHVSGFKVFNVFSYPESTEGLSFCNVYRFKCCNCNRF